MVVKSKDKFGVKSKSNSELNPESNLSQMNNQIWFQVHTNNNIKYSYN